MKESFLNSKCTLLIVWRTVAFFLLILCASFQPVISGQTNVLTRAQFSRISLFERARFFEATITRIALEEEVDPYLLWTIAYNETRFRPWLRSPAGAEGLMQFIPATAARFNLFNPYQPEPAIRAAARYMRFLAKRFGGRIDSILAGYNAGEGAVDAYLWGKAVRANQKIINPGGRRTIGGVPPYRETIGYVARGLIVYRLLELRQLFPGVIVRFLYPRDVAQSVARAWLQDREIGFSGSLLTQISNPVFWNTNTVAQNQTELGQAVSNNFRNGLLTDKNKSLPQNNSLVSSKNPVSASANISVDSNSATSNEEKKAVLQANETYYEPRTGARFKISGSNLERLAESGDLVVGEQVRLPAQPSSIRARGTFFGKKIPVPK